MGIIIKKMIHANRKKSYSNFSEVKNIGIVCDASNRENFASIAGFNQKMQERNIEVKILGYYPGKNLPNDYTAIRYMTFFSRKDINFFYQPVASEINNFINYRFDILIDVNFKKLFPLRCIASLSNASFKVGLLEPDNVHTPLDLMMEIVNPVDVEDYLHQVLHYLEMINSVEV